MATGCSEPREEWFWCDADDVGLEIDGAPHSPSHP
jgi:hypothetical protein